MTIQYQGVWSLQSAAQLQSTQRWVTDPLYKNTTLLLQADDAANAAQNNTFLDSSSNAFSITRNGNTTQGSFTPFSQSPGWWGNYLDASSTLSYTQPALGSVFTLEFWTWPSSIVSGALLYVASSNAPLIGYAGGILSVGQQGAWLITSSTNPTPNQWNHIAVVREGTGSNQLKLYLNGVLTGTGTSATTITSQSATIGGSGLVAYISNLRVVDGTAIYTSNFTPPIAPFTAIAGTVLLTCQSNRFIDANTQVAAKTITTSGSPSVQPFSPFAPQYQWTSSVIGGSGYFNGSSDFLNTATSSAFAFGTGDFTVEAWVYTNSSSSQRVVSIGTAGNFEFLLVNTGSNVYLNFFSGIDYGATSYIVPQRSWVHIAVTRSSNNIRLFINGVLQNTPTALNTDFSTNVAAFVGRFGNSATQFFNGYMSNVRIIKGTAVYTGAFTPPTRPLSASGADSASAYPSTTNVNTSFAASATSLLLNFTNAGIFDGTMKNNLETVGNAQISTAVVKYGSGSIFFNGTTDYLKFPTSDLYAFRTGPWTVEFWVYVTSVANRYAFIDTRSGTSSNLGITFYSNGTAFGAGTIGLQIGNTLIGTSTATLPTNAWTHLAVSASGTSVAVYLNGTSIISGSYTQNLTEGVLLIGVASAVSGSYLSGYMDDIRISRVQRYTANFIPPSVALPRQ